MTNLTRFKTTLPVTFRGQPMWPRQLITPVTARPQRFATKTTSLVHKIVHKIVSLNCFHFQCNGCLNNSHRNAITPKAKTLPSGVRGGEIPNCGECHNTMVHRAKLILTRTEKNAWQACQSAQCVVGRNTSADIMTRPPWDRHTTLARGEMREPRRSVRPLRTAAATPSSRQPAKSSHQLI